jgi:hypothetical protein
VDTVVNHPAMDCVQEKYLRGNVFANSSLLIEMPTCYNGIKIDFEEIDCKDGRLMKVGQNHAQYVDFGFSNVLTSDWILQCTEVRGIQIFTFLVVTYNIP